MNVASTRRGISRPVQTALAGTLGIILIWKAFDVVSSGQQT